MEAYIAANKDRFVTELLDWLRIPSISADSQYKADVRKAAEYLKEKLTAAGADKVELCETKGHPVVYAEKIVGEGLPTVLVYGHYDVQPADPVEQWSSPPFEPVIRDGKIFARGSSDDKGQVYMHVKAFETMMKNNSLPCHMKFMVDGEEEVGSDNLGLFVQQNRDKLTADIILISDTALISLDHPSITT